METTVIKASDFGLDFETAKVIENAFTPKVIERNGLVQVYERVLTKEMSEETSKEAKEVRLKLVKVRTGIAEIHKTQKAFYLAAGRYVDAWKNKETEPVLQMEEKLEEIETYFIRIEQERIRKIETERRELILQYTEVMPAALGLMEESVFQNYLTGVKFAHEARIAEEKRIEAERIAKEKAEEEAREAQRLENIRLKKEAEERERLAEIERKKQADLLAAEKAKAEKERKELEERAAKLKAENDAKLEAERKERERLANELKAKQDKEAAELKAKQEAEKKAKAAPDKENALAYAKQIESIVLPEIGNEEIYSLILKADEYLKKLAVGLRQNIERL